MTNARRQGGVFSYANREIYFQYFGSYRQHSRLEVQCSDFVVLFYCHYYQKNHQMCNAEGKSITNKNFKNKIVLYNFWFDGCKYCHNLFEPLNELFKHYQGNLDFQILSFTVDSPDLVTRNIIKYQLKYPVVPITNEACHDLMFDKGFPANFLVDENGIIVFGMGVSPLINNNNFFNDELIPMINALLANLKKAD